MNKEKLEEVKDALNDYSQDIDGGLFLKKLIVMVLTDIAYQLTRIVDDKKECN